MKIEVEFEGMEESLEALAKFIEAEERAVVDALEWILRQMIRYVKDNGPWKDHTSNLRNSISINLDTMQEWPADTPPETFKALIKQNETPVIQVEGDGYAGCLSAGMEYAIWVETKEGYWVLSGAIDKFEPLIEKYFEDKLAVEKLDLEQTASVAYLKYKERKKAKEAAKGGATA